MSTLQFASLVTLGVANLAGTAVFIKIALTIRQDALETRDEVRREVDDVRTSTNEFKDRLAQALISTRF